MVAGFFTVILCMASLLDLVKYLAMPLNHSEVHMHVIVVLSFYSVVEHCDALVGVNRVGE